MTTAATRDKTGKFARAAKDEAAETPQQDGGAYPAWDDLEPWARELPFGQMGTPVSFIDWAAHRQAEAEVFELLNDLESEVYAELAQLADRIDREFRPLPRRAMSGCADPVRPVPVASKPAVTLVASRPLGELEPADQARLDRWDAAIAAERKHDTTPGFPPVSQDWGEDGETPAGTPGPEPQPSGPGDVPHEPRQDDEALDQVPTLADQLLGTRDDEKDGEA